MTGLLDGKVAFVTGAGSGIGKACVLLFAAEGANVVAADVSGAERDTAAAAAAGDRVLPVHCDVTQEDDVEAGIAAAVNEFGRLDTVLNVAGIAIGGAIADAAMDDYDALLDVNLRGTLLGMKHGIRAMVDGGSRRIHRQLVGDRRPHAIGRQHAVPRGVGGCALGHEERGA